MKTVVIRYLNLLALICIAAWFGIEVSWRAAGALCAALATFIGLDRHVAKTLHRYAADKDLFNEFMKAVPVNGTIQFLRTTYLSAGFRNEDLRDLDGFQHDWNDG